MAIYEPNLVLSKADREALWLLSQLVLAAESGATGNVDADAITLSHSQAERLLVLLEQLIETKRFIEGCYFAEGIANGEGWKDPNLREIYLSWRTRLGFTRVASTFTWNEFVVRAGFSTSSEAQVYPRPTGSRVRPMSLEYFMAMEMRLSSAAGLHPRITKLVEEMLRSRLPLIEGIRTHEIAVPTGLLKGFAVHFVEELGRAQSGTERESMTRGKLVAMSTLVMDAGALFITRDWTATATISMVGSTLPDVIR